MKWEGHNCLWDRNLLSKGKRLLDKGSPDSQKKVDRVLEIQEWERRRREGKVLRVLLLEYAKELGIDSLPISGLLDDGSQEFKSLSFTIYN